MQLYFILLSYAFSDMYDNYIKCESESIFNLFKYLFNAQTLFCWDFLFEINVFYFQIYFLNFADKNKYLLNNGCPIKL